jgi:septin family protein
MSGLKGISSTHQFFKRERLKKLKEAERHLAKSQRQLEDGGINYTQNEAKEGSEERVKKGHSKGKEMTCRSIQEHGLMSQERARQQGRGKTQNEKF